MIYQCTEHSTVLEYNKLFSFTHGEVGENPCQLELQSVSGLGTLKQSDTLSDDA
jgi:hypothetical protein